MSDTIQLTFKGMVNRYGTYIRIAEDASGQEYMHLRDAFGYVEDEVRRLTPWSNDEIKWLSLLKKRFVEETTFGDIFAKCSDGNGASLYYPAYLASEVRDFMHDIANQMAVIETFKTVRGKAKSGVKKIFKVETNCEASFFDADKKHSVPLVAHVIIDKGSIVPVVFANGTAFISLTNFIQRLHKAPMNSYWRETLLDGIPNLRVFLGGARGAYSITHFDVSHIESVYTRTRRLNHADRVFSGEREERAFLKKFLASIGDFASKHEELISDHSKLPDTVSVLTGYKKLPKIGGKNATASAPAPALVGGVQMTIETPAETSSVRPPSPVSKAAEKMVELANILVAKIEKLEGRIAELETEQKQMRFEFFAVSKETKLLDDLINNIEAIQH